MEVLIVFCGGINILIGLILFVMFRSLSGRLAKVEEQLTQGEGQAAVVRVQAATTAPAGPVSLPGTSPPETASPVQTDTPAPPPETAQVEPVAETPLAQPDALAAEDEPFALPPIPDEPIPAPVPAKAPAAGPRTGPVHWLLERIRQTSLIVQVGVVLLFFGIAFLLRFAAEQGWLSVELRLAGSTVFGVALIGLGWRLRGRRRVYALALQGGGIGILYLVTFAALRLYAMIPPALAFGIFVGLGVACVGLALVNNARILAFLAVIGAFLAPVLAATDSGNHVGLFSYYALINLGILVIAWFKAWRSLNLAGFFFTLGVGATWGITSYEPAYFATVEPFLIFFFVLYTCIAILFSFRQTSNRLHGYVDAALVFGAPIAFFTLQSLIIAEFDNGIGLSALGTGVWYLLLAGLLFWRVRQSHQLLVESFAFLAVAFLTTSVPLLLSNETTAIVWAVEGAGLVWVGSRQNRLWSRLVGILILAGSSLVLLYEYYDREYVFQAAERSALSLLVSSALLSISFFLASFALGRSSKRSSEDEEGSGQQYLALRYLMTLGGFFWWYGTGIYHILEFVPERFILTGLLSFLALSAALADWFHRRFHWQLLNWPAELLLLTTLPFLAWFLLDGNPPSAGFGWIAWLLVLVGHYLGLRLNKGRSGQAIHHASGLWLAVFLLTAEVAIRVDGTALGEGWWWTALLGVPTVALWAIDRLAERLPWPFGPHGEVYRTLGLIPVVLVVLGVGAIANGTTAVDVAPLPNWPLVNPFDLVQVLAFVGVLVWLNRLRKPGADSNDFTLYFYVVGLLAFWAVNAGIARAVHHLGGVPFVWEDLFASTVLQTLYSVFWGLFALILMFTGTRRASRGIWLGGALLLALTVIKLFLVDLSSANTIGRIVSFIGVGILVLIIGYFAPVPPDKEEAETEEVETLER